MARYLLESGTDAGLHVVYDHSLANKLTKEKTGPGIFIEPGGDGTITCEVFVNEELPEQYATTLTLSIPTGKLTFSGIEFANKIEFKTLTIYDAKEEKNSTGVQIPIGDYEAKLRKLSWSDSKIEKELSKVKSKKDVLADRVGGLAGLLFFGGIISIFIGGVLYFDNRLSLFSSLWFALPILLALPLMLLVGKLEDTQKRREIMKDFPDYVLTLKSINTTA